MKTFIQNRKGEKLAVVVEENPEHKGLVFIMHGLGGFKEQPQLQIFGEAFRENGFSVVFFDTTNTFGESDGNYEDATVTNYYEDLEDVIAWAKTENWYQEPFWLAGHSLGGFTAAFFAENHPEKVKAVAPIAPMVSGKLTLTAPKYHGNTILEDWKRTGILEENSQSLPGVVKRLKWSHMEDRMKYDLSVNVDKLTMPVLIIVGENDVPTPLQHQKILFEKLPGKKEMHIIKGAPHTFKDTEHLKEIKNIFDNWIKKYA